jgi:hypothetical protein
MVTEDTDAMFSEMKHLFTVRGETVIHIRTTRNPFKVACRAEGKLETISEFHFAAHVEPEKDGCCKELYKVLCPECKALCESVD